MHMKGLGKSWKTTFSVLCASMVYNLWEDDIYTDLNEAVEDRSIWQTLIRDVFTVISLLFNSRRRKYHHCS